MYSTFSPRRTRTVSKKYLVYLSGCFGVKEKSLKQENGLTGKQEEIDAGRNV